jgi:hypothetical protein
VRGASPASSAASLSTAETPRASRMPSLETACSRVSAAVSRAQTRISGLTPGIGSSCRRASQGGEGPEYRTLKTEA